MNAFKSLMNMLRKLFLDTRAGPDAHEPHNEPEGAGISSGGGKTRCANPDIGCPFEVS